MTMTLRDLEACFEGVIPSIIATADAEGVPNISYLSHVSMVDDEHVALSNQFFAKTAANIRLNPKATLVVVDGLTGAQFRLQLAFAYTLEGGALFDRLAQEVAAGGAQVGLGDVMRLRCVDVFRVVGVEAVPSPVETAAASTRLRPDRLIAAERIVADIAAATDAGGVVDALLGGIAGHLGFGHALLFQSYGEKAQITAIGSTGYVPSGIGAEVPFGEGLIGSAAASGRIVKVSDMSRIRRFGSAVRHSSPDENRTREIVLPGMADAMSQIAVPLLVQGHVEGVLFVESGRRLAFTREDEAALAIVARQAAVSLALCERMSFDPEAAFPADVATAPGGSRIDVAHHPFDDSVFINGDYVIKGVAGRLLVHMLGQYLDGGRREFTNREIRLDASLRLPDYKDNLETRLLLLRRRLDEKHLPIRLLQLGRGKIGLAVEGDVRLTRR